MKRVVSVGVCLLLLCSVAWVATAAQGPVIKGEPAGQTRTTVMDEHFYSGTLEPNFTSDSVKVKTDSYGMHFEGAYHYGAGLVLNAYKLKDYNRFTFSIDCIETTGGFLYCAFGGPDASSDLWKYDDVICFTRSVTALYEMGGSDMKFIGQSAPLTNALVNGQTTDFALTIKRVSGKDFKVVFEVIDDGEVVASTDYGTTVRLQYDHGYFGMWSGLNEKFNLRNFKVYDSPTHVAFSDNFENSTLTYADELAGNSNWHINRSDLTREDVYICRNAGPEFKKVGDTMTAKEPLVSCKEVSKPYEISFETRISELPKNAVYGLFFGAQKSVDLKKATVIGVSAYNDKFAAINLIKNGKVINPGEKLIPLSTLELGWGTINISAEIHNDYSVLVNIGGVQVRFNNIKYDGYWGVCDYSLDKKSSAVARVDEMTVIRNTYDTCTQPDLSNDFGGIRLTPDGFEEYYISDRTYYIGPGVSLRPKGAFTKEPSLYFEAAGSYSAFAPKQKYTDYILQFDVKMISSGTNGQTFGVSFGRNSYAAIDSNCTSVSFTYNGWTGTPYTHIATNLCDLDDGTRERKIEDYHFYKDTETKYNFMVVAKNRTVYVYFKEDGEDISKLGICRAIVPNVNTAGYVAIFGNNGISFDVFNYKLTNISGEATGDSPIALREAFEKEQISDKLKLEGNAKVENGALQLSGGSIAMNNKSRYSIVNFTVLNSKADVTVEFAGNDSVTLSKDLKKVTLREGNKAKIFDVTSYHLADYKNVQFQMILQYDGLILAAKGIYESYDKLSSPIAEYTFSKPLNAGILKWRSDNAVLDDLSVYSLDNSYKAVSVSYDEDPNDTEMWFKKDVIVGRQPVGANADGDSGLPLIFIILYSVIGAVIVALLVWIIVTLAKKRGKAQ